MQNTTEEHNGARLNSIRNIKLQKIGVTFIQELIQIGRVDLAIQDCILALIKEPSSRKANDIEKIKSFLETTALATKFRSDNFNAESLNKILFMCSGEMRHCYLEKGKTLFHIGDVGDKFYIVLQGRVAVLQPTPITDQMTGFELYRHLLNLRKNNEMYMFNLTLDANKNIVDIDKRDLEQLNLMVLVMCIQDYFSHVNFIGRTIPEILTLCGVDPHFFDGIIDESNNEARDANLLENVEHKIFDRLPKFDQTIIQRYRILSNNVVRFKVNLFKYKNIIELGKGTFFGDTALDKLTTRNATIQTTDDTHFCFLGNNHYSSYIKLEKERLTNKEINFIVDNFFLKDIPYKLFEQKVFANFYYHELTKREIICQENQTLEYLYFIKEGIIELSIKKNIPELYETTTNLSKLDYTCLNPPASTFPIIKPYPKDHVAKVNFLYKTTKTKIYNYSQKEVIGFESLCFNMNYLYTAEVISDKVKLYKVHKSYVMKLLNEDISYYEKFVHDGSQKMFLFLKRLNELYQMKLEQYEKTTKKQIYETAFDQNIDRSTFGKCKNDHFEYCPVLKVFKEKNTKLDMNELILPTKLKGVSPVITLQKDIIENNHIRSPYFTSIPVKKNKRQIRYRNLFKSEHKQDCPKTTFPSVHSNISHTNYTFTTTSNEDGVFSVKREERLLKKIQHHKNKDNLIYSTILTNKMNRKNGIDIDDLYKGKAEVSCDEIGRKRNVLLKNQFVNKDLLLMKRKERQVGSITLKKKYNFSKQNEIDKEYSEEIIPSYTIRGMKDAKYRFKPMKKMKVKYMLNI